MKSLLTALALCSALAACGTTPQQDVSIAAPIVKAVATAVPGVGNALSAAANIACAAQAAANADGVIQAAQGNAKGVADASALSTATGLLCTW